MRSGIVTRVRARARPRRPGRARPRAPSRAAIAAGRARARRSTQNSRRDGGEVARAPHPGGGGQLGDEPRRPSAEHRVQPQGRAVDLVDRAVAVAEREELAVEPRRHALGERQLGLVEHGRHDRHASIVPPAGPSRTPSAVIGGQPAPVDDGRGSEPLPPAPERGAEDGRGVDPRGEEQRHREPERLDTDARRAGCRAACRRRRRSRSRRRPVRACALGMRPNSAVSISGLIGPGRDARTARARRRPPASGAPSASVRYGGTPASTNAMMNSGRARDAVPDRAEQRGAAERAAGEAGQHRAQDGAVVAERRRRTPASAR